MIRLTIDPLIADLPWPKNRSGGAIETPNGAASQGNVVVYCSFGGGAPGQMVDAVWTLVVEDVAPRARAPLRSWRRIFRRTRPRTGPCRPCRGRRPARSAGIGIP